MNKYYIKKGNVVRFEISKTLNDGKLEMSNLYFLKYNKETTQVDSTRTKWRNNVFYILNKDSWSWHDKIRIKPPVSKYIFEFETDEDALLFEEMMDE